MEELGNTMEIYERGTSLDADNAFATMVRSVSNIWQPFLSKGKSAFPVGSGISAVVGNQPDQVSTVFSQNTISSHRFFTERYIAGDTMLENCQTKGWRFSNGKETYSRKRTNRYWFLHGTPNSCCAVFQFVL